MFFLSLAYSILAGAEVVVLLASTIGLMAFAVRQAVRAIDSLLDAAVDAASPDTKPRLMSPSNVVVASHLHKIRGGHNEIF